MADISKTVAIIFEGEDRTPAALAKVEAGLRGVDDAGRRAGSGVDQASQLWQDAAGRWRNATGQFASDTEKAAAGLVGVSTASAGAGKGVDSLAAAVKGLAIAATVTEFISANVALEKFEKTMEAATGSSTAAAREFDFVRGVADRFGVELLVTADAYAKFSASAKGTALEGEGARLIFEGFTGTMARLGASSADVSGALVQLGQGVSKGKFELDDLKSIAERIPGFFAQFAESLGVSTAELYDLISAGKIGSEELLIFSDTLRAGLAGVDFDGFAASSARFKNAISEAYLELGQTGAFDVLTKGVHLGTASIVGIIAAFETLGDIIGSVAGAILSGNWSSLGDVIAEAIGRGADKTKAASNALLGVEDAAKKTGDAAEDAGRKIADGMDKGAMSAKDMDKAAADVDKALKALGIDPKQFVDPIEAVKKAFSDLANNPAVKGDQLFAGFLVTLDKIKSATDIKALGDQIRGAFDGGKISVDAFAAAMQLLASKQDGTYKGMVAGTAVTKENADALARQAKEAEKAAEAAAKVKLELEKLASNERIKLIEARVQLNVAQIQADTERIKAVIGSIDTTIKSTGDLLGSLFGKLDSQGNSFRDQWAIEKQIGIENDRRDEALRLQKDLTKAQIDEMRARTQSLLAGDALIKIDGAGLKPHLEAFMWEILRTIQTRVNRDGLKLLLGT